MAHSERLGKHGDEEPARAATLEDLLGGLPSLHHTAEGYVSHLLRLIERDMVTLQTTVSLHRQKLMQAESLLLESGRARDMLEQAMEALAREPR